MRKAWTDEEVIFLKENYFGTLNAEIAIELSRSIASIQRKANDLGLRKSKELLAKIKSEARIGEKCWNWKGGRKHNKGGYVLILKRGYPGTDINGYILEHRYVMEQVLGRKLRENEIVHHKNEVKDDNRPENLYVEERGKHTIRHHSGKRKSDEAKSKISNAAKKRFKNKENHPSYKPVDIKKLFELRAQGVTVENVCKIFGISKRTYYNKIKGEVA